MVTKTLRYQEIASAKDVPSAGGVGGVVHVGERGEQIINNTNCNYPFNINIPNSTSKSLSFFSGSTNSLLSILSSDCGKARFALWPLKTPICAAIFEHRVPLSKLNRLQLLHSWTGRNCDEIFHFLGTRKSDDKLVKLVCTVFHSASDAICQHKRPPMSESRDKG